MWLVLPRAGKIRNVLSWQKQCFYSLNCLFSCLWGDKDWHFWFSFLNNTYMLKQNRFHAQLFVRIRWVHYVQTKKGLLYRIIQYLSQEPYMYLEPWCAPLFSFCDSRLLTALEEEAYGTEPNRLWYHKDCVIWSNLLSCMGPASCQTELQL